MKIKDIPHYDRLVLGRNESFKESTWLALVSLMWLPASLVDSMRGSAQQFFGGLANLVAGGIAGVICFALWLLVRLVLVIAGIAGFLTLSPSTRVDDPRAAR